MNKKLEGKKVFNDVIDEAYELEDAEEIMEEKKIENQLVDGEINVTDDSQNYLPTPDDEANDDSGIHLNFTKEETFRKKRANLHSNNEEIEKMNLPNEVKEIFKFIPAFIPQSLVIPSSFKPFIPEYIPAVGEVDAFIKPPRPDGINEYLGIEIIDE